MVERVKTAPAPLTLMARTTPPPFSASVKTEKDARPRDVAHIHNGQVEAQIRLVAAIAVHGLQPCDPPEGMRHGAAHHPLKQPGEQIPEKREHILLVHETSLHVHLG